MPTDWKKASVTSMCKKGPKGSALVYRAIYLNHLSRTN